MAASKISISEWISLLIIGGGFILLVFYYFPEFSAYLGEEQKDEQNRNYRLSDFGQVIPSQYQIMGIDVSRYQGEIDWEAVRQMNIQQDSVSFVFLKATEGNEYRDPFFLYNWQAVKDQGLFRGAYHFYSPNINSRRQAEHFIRSVNLESGDLPPILDIETLGKYPIDNLRRGLKNWLKIVEAHYGVRPIIYTNFNYYHKYLAGHFDNHQFWLARYGTQTPKISPKKWTFWQFSDAGLVNGIAGKVDLNVFQGSRTELEALTKP